MKLQARLFSLLAACAFAFMIAFSGSVATAQPAEASTKSNCDSTWNSTIAQVKTYCHFKYNWFEKSVLGKYDGIKVRWCDYKGSTVFNCTKWYD